MLLSGHILYAERVKHLSLVSMGDFLIELREDFPFCNRSSGHRPPVAFYARRTDPAYLRIACAPAASDEPTPPPARGAPHAALELRACRPSMSAAC